MLKDYTKKTIPTNAVKNCPKNCIEQDAMNGMLRKQVAG
jgi:hypothetical protein